MQEVCVGDQIRIETEKYEGLSENHGNKRTAITATGVFLLPNG
jgi:prophage maintenance system killer protein